MDISFCQLKGLKLLVGWVPWVQVRAWMKKWKNKKVFFALGLCQVIINLLFVNTMTETIETLKIFDSYLYIMKGIVCVAYYAHVWTWELHSITTCPPAVCLSASAADYTPHLVSSTLPKVIVLNNNNNNTNYQPSNIANHRRTVRLSASAAEYTPQPNLTE